MPIGKVKELDFRPRKGGKARPLGSVVIDGCFSRLVPDSDGWFRTWVHDPENDVRITVFQDQGLMHVFTGDPLPARPRQSIAPEPVTPAVPMPPHAGQLFGTGFTPAEQAAQPEPASAPGPETEPEPAIVWFAPSRTTKKQSLVTRAGTILQRSGLSSADGSCTSSPGGRSSSSTRLSAWS